MLTVDYDYYFDTFHGQMDAADFERMTVYASAYLEELTMGRASGALPAQTAEKVKLALCAVADAYRINEQRDGIASESNDGVSITYAGSNEKASGSRLYEAASLFLAGTGLLYRGVR